MTLLIVEDGTGLATANSYVSLAEANTYFSVRNLLWTGSDSVKEMALVQASEYITARWEPVLKGRRLSIEQSLAFPRVLNIGAILPPAGFYFTGNYHQSINPLEQAYFNGIHSQLKQAVFQYALRALSTRLMTDPATESPIEEIATSVAGAVSKRVKYRVQSQFQHKQFFEADSLMIPFIRSSQGAIR